MSPRIYGEIGTMVLGQAPPGARRHIPPNAYVMYFIYVGKPAQVIAPMAKEMEDPKARTGRIECIKNASGRCKT